MTDVRMTQRPILRRGSSVAMNVMNPGNIDAQPTAEMMMMFIPGRRQKKIRGRERGKKRKPQGSSEEDCGPLGSRRRAPPQRERHGAREEGHRARAQHPGPGPPPAGTGTRPSEDSPPPRLATPPPRGAWQQRRHTYIYYTPLGADQRARSRAAPSRRRRGSAACRGGAGGRGGRRGGAAREHQRRQRLGPAIVWPPAARSARRTAPWAAARPRSDTPTRPLRRRRPSARPPRRSVGICGWGVWRERERAYWAARPSLAGGPGASVGACLAYVGVCTHTHAHTHTHTHTHTHVCVCVGI